MGPVPPPYHGCSVATAFLLDSELRDDFEIRHLDTSDRRDLNNLGKWDVRNIALGIWSVVQMAYVSVVFRPAIVYVPISQGTAGFIRDGLLILCATSVGKANVMLHLHGASFLRFYESQSRLARWFVRLVMRRVAHGIVLGERLRAQFHPWLRDEQVSVVPNGTAIQADVRRRLLGDERFTVLFLGNLLKFKGVTRVIDAVADIQENVPQIRAQFAGRWTDDPIYRQSASDIQSECMQAVARARRPDAFEFLGEVNRERVALLLAGADVLVLPSEDEGMPIVILEAMAAGVPVIASEGVGAIPDVVIHGQTGFLVPSSDTKALGDSIVRLARDRALRDHMARSARERWEREYSARVWTRRIGEVLQNGHYATSLVEGR